MQEDRPMIQRASAASWHALSRRRLIMLGAGAALAGLSPQRAKAVLKLDVTPGNVQPIPIAIPDFVSVATADPAAGAQCQPDHRVQPAALRSLRPDRSSRLYRKNLDHRHAAPLCRLAADQRAGAGHRRGRRRATAGSRPSSGCGTCSPASSCTASNTPPRPRTGGASPTSSPTRSTSGSPARRAISTRRVVFVDESGPKDRRVKRLAIMDQDGANVRYLTRGDDLVLTPRFSPSTSENHLHVLRPGRSAAGLSHEHRDRPARDRRQLPRHDLRARASRPTASA